MNIFIDTFGCTSNQSISESILYQMLAEGTQAQRRLKSNANLRLLAESYLMRLRVAFQTL